MRSYLNILILVACGVTSACGADLSADSNHESTSEAEPQEKEAGIPYDMSLSLGEGIILHRGVLVGNFLDHEVDAPANILDGKMSNGELTVKVIVENESEAFMSLLVLGAITDALIAGEEFHQDANVSTNGCYGTSAENWTRDAHTEDNYIKGTNGPDGSTRVLFNLYFNQGEDQLIGSFDFSRTNDGAN